MNIRAKLSLMTATLIASVVLALAGAVHFAQRTALQDQSQRRLQGLSDGVARLAQESLENRDPLMLLSYLMTLQKEHPELAYAAVTSGERTSRLGTDRADLMRWNARVEARHQVKYTVVANNQGLHPAAALSVSTAGARIDITGDARLTVEEAHATPSLDLTLGFDGGVVQAEIAAALRPLTRRTAGIAGFFMLLGWLGAFSFAKLLTAPLTALTAAVGSIRGGNLDVSVPAGGRDEVGLLAQRFNEMTAHLKEHSQFREDLLHTLTHELNTPLGGLKGYLELWQDRKLPADGPERDEILQTMSAAVQRMEHSLNDALALFRAGTADATRADKRVVWIDDLLREACVLFAPVARAKGITLTPPSDGVTKCLFADDELLRRIVVNLVSNALKYTPDGGRITLGLASDESMTRFWVADTGRGIKPEDLTHLFTKFYRVEQGGGRRRIPGTGLGLNIAQKAAAELGGVIAVSSTLGEGTTFTVDFPKTQQTKPEAI